MTTSNIISRSPRIADFQSAPGKAPRPLRKNRLRSKKTLASIARKRQDFGASPSSKRSLQSCAEQNDLREYNGKIAKEKNRMQGDGAFQRIASLWHLRHSIAVSRVLLPHA
jgi:hypothetical protein